MSPPRADDGGSASTELAARLGVELRDPGVLDLALTHRSYAYENELEETNERLELLGDAVLSLVVTDLLFKRFPEHVEGDLAKLRASLVSEPALAEVAAELDLGEEVRLGRGEEMTGGRLKASILSDTLEAVIGAVYLDRGITTSRKVIRRLFGPRIRAATGREVPKDAKTHLQEEVLRVTGELPLYVTTGEGPDHMKRFRAEVYVHGALYGTGEGRSKKGAEQSAATRALERLREDGPEPSRAEVSDA